jgi:hypothetical protein
LVWLTGKFIEQSPVMNHCLTQIFGCGGALKIAYGDIMAFSIALRGASVMDGYVRSTLCEIKCRIAFGGHDFANESVGLLQCFRGIVHETSLDITPTVPEVGLFGWIEVANSELLNASFARDELSFAAETARELADGAFVLRPELIYETPGAALLQKVYEPRTQNEADCDCDECEKISWVHDAPALANVCFATSWCPEVTKRVHEIRPPNQIAFPAGTSVVRVQRNKMTCHQGIT